MRWLSALMLLLFCTACNPPATRPGTGPLHGGGAEPEQSTPATPDTMDYPEYTLEQCLAEMQSADEFQRMSAMRDLTSHFTDAEARTALPEVIRLLESDPEPMVRKAAVQKLRRLAEDPLDCLPHLQAALADEDAGVRAAAAEQMARLGPPAAACVPGLLALLADGSSTAGDAAATALRNIDSSAMLKLVPGLLAQLKNGTVSERAAAASALGSIGPFTVLTEADTDWSSMNRWRPRRYDGGMTITFSRVLTESLPPVSGELDQRVAAVPGALRRALIEDDNREVRLAAIRSLGRFQQYSLDSIGLLRSFLKADDPRYREACASALAEIGPSGSLSLDDLITSLYDINNMVVLDTLRALRERGHEATAALPELRELIGRTYMGSGLGPEIAAVLANLGPEAAAAVPELIAHIEDRGSSSDSALVEALGVIGPDAAAAIPALTALVEKDCTISPVAAISLAQIDPAGEQVLPVLQAGLTAGNMTCVGCGIALGEISTLPDDVIDDLIAGLAPGNRANTACCKALSDKAMQSPRVIPALAETLDSEKPVPSSFAGLALVQNGEAYPELVPGIIEELARRKLLDDHRGALVAGWLVEDDETAAQLLLPALRHRDRNFYSGLAAFGLAERKEAARAAVPDLLDCFDTDDSALQLVAAYALTQIDPPALAGFVPQLAEWLYLPPCDFRLNAIWVLGEVAAIAEPALPALRLKLDDPDDETRRAAALAIRRIEAALEPELSLQPELPSTAKMQP